MIDKDRRQLLIATGGIMGLAGCAITTNQGGQASSEGTSGGSQSSTGASGQDPSGTQTDSDSVEVQTDASQGTGTQRSTDTETGSVSEETDESEQTDASTSSDSKNIDAKITGVNLSTGVFYPGDTQTTDVTIKNIGNTGHTFYAGYSVLDPNGEGWHNGGDPPSVTLDPYKLGTVTVDWTVEDTAPTGGYGVSITVRESWEDGDFGETLDNYREDSDIFTVDSDSQSSTQTESSNEETTSEGTQTESDSDETTTEETQTQTQTEAGSEATTSEESDYYGGVKNTGLEVTSSYYNYEYSPMTLSVMNVSNQDLDNGFVLVQFLNGGGGLIHDVERETGKIYTDEEQNFEVIYEGHPDEIASYEIYVASSVHQTYEFATSQSV